MIKEKIINILTSELSYSYCDNCKDKKLYGNRYCLFNCYKKYQNQTLSPDTAERLADQILNLIQRQGGII